MVRDLNNTFFNRDFWFISGVSIVLLFIPLFFSIHYIEDPDSLRFALAVNNFDPAHGVPHFPIYPIYVYLAQLLNFALNSYSVSLTLIGGLAQTLIFIFFYKWTTNKWMSLAVGVQPVLLLMATRFMPDLLGVSIVMMVFYYTYKREKLHLAVLLSVLLLGVRLSYFPLLIIPFIQLFQRGWKKVILLSMTYSILMIGSLFILMTSEELIQVGLDQFNGHFNEFGGGIISESHSFLERLKFFYERLLFNGFSIIPDYNFYGSALILVGILYISIQSFRSKVELNKALLFSIVLYGIWILFFQNIIYKFRHVLPLIPLILLMVTDRIENWNRVVLGLFIIGLFINSFLLLSKHKNKSAVAQVVDHMKIDQSSVVISSKLLNYVLLTQEGKGKEFWDLESIKESVRELKKGEKVLLVGDFEFFDQKIPVKELDLTHNEWVNPMWSELKYRLYVID